MCNRSKAQRGIVYQAASTGFLTETVLDPEGGFVAHVPVEDEDEKRFVLNEDGSFEEVQFDMNAGRGECPWKRTGQGVDAPLELKEAGRFILTL